ncbi:15441_t:CDS:1 [Cetraspora pellucida]|uniref:15441_t:CDS:1 n=1 Tax=Cetraspora pellucida TaxID=1433469 RepID=A0A9N9FD15_9GLOM|nr:15441_t:CDS:1 [Cetraspora pellucida]
MRALIRYWRSKEIICKNYVNNFWVAHPYQKVLLYIRDSVILEDLKTCRFVIAEKDYLDSAQNMKYYGIVLDTVTKMVTVPNTKINDVICCLQNILVKKHLTA